ncbi:MAG: lipid A deacylase LpxR family protein [Pseudomonadota bacterium]
MFGPKRQLLYSLLLMVLLSSVAHAETETSGSFISLQMENDFFADSGDRYYTHGTQLSLLNKEAPPAFLAKVADWTPFYQQGNSLNLVQYTLGQKIFTPNNTEATTVVDGDRPYAGYLYFSATVLSQIGSSLIFDHSHIDYGNMFEVTLGVVGPSAMSEETQTGFHDLVGIDSPSGWDNQLEDELAIGLMYSRFWRLVQPVTDGVEFGVNPHISMSLGNVYTYGAGGVMFRLGNNLRRDLSPPNIRPGFPGPAYFQTSNEASWYVYLGFETRLVLRDIFLDGNTFTDSHSVEKELLVGDMQFGIVYMLGDVRITFSNMIRTDEFKTQQVSTQYGALNLTYQY